jgi:hypothetical protein
VQIRLIVPWLSSKVGVGVGEEDQWIGAAGEVILF